MHFGVCQSGERLWGRIGHERIIIYALSNEAIIRAINTSFYSMRHLTARHRQSAYLQTVRRVASRRTTRSAANASALL